MDKKNSLKKIGGNDNYRIYYDIRNDRVGFYIRKKSKKRECKKKLIKLKDLIKKIDYIKLK